MYSVCYFVNNGVTFDTPDFIRNSAGRYAKILRETVKKLGPEAQIMHLSILPEYIQVNYLINNWFYFRENIASTVTLSGIRKLPQTFQ